MNSQYVSIVVASAALILSYFALRNTRQTKKFELYWEVLKSYNSPEMLNALQSVWKLIDDNNREREKVITTYKQHREDSLPTHSHRRRISTLYQQLAFLRSNNLIPRKFKKTFPDLDLSIIEFLFWMEEYGINVRSEKPKHIPENEIADHYKPMYDMYNDWVRVQKERKRRA